MTDLVPSNNNKKSTEANHREPSAAGSALLEHRPVGHPLRRLNLVEEVVDQLEAKVLSGQFASGEVMPPEGRLSHQFGVSRTVIREAMRTLCARGLIEVSQGRPPRVKPVDIEDVIKALDTFMQRTEHTVEHLLELRRPLEAEIAGLAAQRRTPAQIAALEEAVGQLGTARTPEKQIDADLRFHELLAEATQNPILSMLMKALAGLLGRTREEPVIRVGVEPCVACHREIAEAVRQGDAEAARQSMFRHVDQVIRDIERDGS